MNQRKKRNINRTHLLKVNEEFPERFPNEVWKIEVSKTKQKDELLPMIDDLLSKDSEVALVKVDHGYIVFRKWERRDTDMGKIIIGKDRKSIRGRIIQTWEK